MAYFYRVVAVFLLALCGAMIWTPAYASFPATQTNVGACTVAPCYEYKYEADSYHYIYNTAGGIIYSSWITTKLGACTDLWQKMPSYHQDLGSPNVTNDTGDVTGECRFGTSIKDGQPDQRTVNAQSPAYSCPANSTLSGSTCTCTAPSTQK